MAARGWWLTVPVLLLVGGITHADEKARLEKALRYAEAVIEKTEAKIQTLDREIAELDAKIRKREADAKVLQTAYVRYLARLQPLAEQARQGVEGAKARFQAERRAVDAEIERDEALGKLGVRSFAILEREARFHAHPDMVVQGCRKERKVKVKARQHLQKILDDTKRLRWELEGGLAALGRPPPTGPGGQGVVFVAGWQMPTVRVAVDIPVPLNAHPSWWVLAPNGSLLTFDPDHAEAAPYVDLLAPSGPVSADEALERFEAAAVTWSKLMAGGWVVGFEAGPVTRVDGDYLVRVEIDGRVRYEYRHPEEHGAATIGWLEFAPLAETVPYESGGTAPAAPPPAVPQTHEGYYEAKIVIVTVKGPVYRAARLVDVERETLVDEVKDPITGEVVKEVPVTAAYARDLAGKVRENQIRALARPVDPPDPDDYGPYHPAPTPAEFRAMHRDRCMHDSTAECKKVFDFLRRTPGCTAADMTKVLRTWAVAQNHLLGSPSWAYQDSSPFTHMLQFIMGCKTVASVESYALLKNLANRVRVKSVDEPKLADFADTLSVHLAELSLSIGAWDRAERDLATATKRQAWWPTSAHLQNLAAKLDTR